MNAVPEVSVIIPTNNNASITDAVESVLANPAVPPFEIIVVGRDDSHAVPKDDRVVFVEAADATSPSASRNAGAARATGAVLMFTDSDCIVDNNWIRNGAAALSGGGGIVGGAIRFAEDSRWDLGDNIAIFRKLHVSCRPRVVKDHLGTNNLAVTREVFDTVNGFDPAVPWPSEDLDFLNRLRERGVVIRFDPSFAVLHRSGRNTREAVVAHARSYGRGLAEMLSSGRMAPGPLRMDGVFGNAYAAAFWSALRAIWQTALIFTCNIRLLKYIRAFPAVWLFCYERRREIFRHISSHE